MADGHGAVDAMAGGGSAGGGTSGGDAEALDRYWDGLVRGGGVHPGGLAAEDVRPAPRVDAGWTTALRQLHARDDAPAPAPAFAARLRRDLFGAGAAASAASAGWADSVAAEPRVAAGGARSLGLVHPVLGWRSAGRAVAAVAAAIALALIGGLDPDRLVPGLIGSTPTVAAEEWVPPSASGAAGCSSTATPAAAAGAVPRPGIATATAAAGAGQGCGDGR